MKFLQKDFEACIQYMHFPTGHQKVLTTTNLLERSFVEQKRRTRIIPRFFDEKSFLKIVYAALVRVSEKWRRVMKSEYDLTILKSLRKL
jgi:transposase-like protein